MARAESERVPQVAERGRDDVEGAGHVKGRDWRGRRRSGGPRRPGRAVGPPASSEAAPRPVAL